MHDRSLGLRKLCGNIIKLKKRAMIMLIVDIK